MASLTRKKRLALIAILIREKWMRSTDNLFGLFVKEIRKCHNKAKLDLTAFQNASTGESEKLVCMLREVNLAMHTAGSLKSRYQQIEAALNNNPEAITKHYDRLVIHCFNNPLQFLTRRYTSKLPRGLLVTYIAPLRENQYAVQRIYLSEGIKTPWFTDNESGRRYKWYLTE